MSDDRRTKHQSGSINSVQHIVGIVIVSHSLKLAEGVAELAREMAGPDVRLAAVGGLPLPDHPLGTDAQQIAKAIESVYSDSGVVVLMDLGSALLSTDVAMDLLPAKRRRNVVLCEAPIVEGAIAAAVQARLGSPLARVLEEARAALGPKVEHLRSSLSTAAADRVGEPSTRDDRTRPPSDHPSPSRELRLIVRNPLGLHARPAARLVQTAASFDAELRVTNLTNGQGPANARSITAISTLGVLQNHEILVSAVGPAANEALHAIRQLAEANFGDRDGPIFKSPPYAGLAIPSTRLNGEARLDAIAASPGIAIGKIRQVRLITPSFPERSVSDPNRAWNELSDAIGRARVEIRATRDAAARRGEADAAAIFDAHLLILEDEAVLEPARRVIFDRQLDAAAAWRSAIDHLADRYRSIGDEYLRARVADVIEVGRQVSSQILGATAPLPAFDEPVVLIAAELGPADVARLDQRMVLGIALAFGGPTSHAAIVARARGIPLVVGLGPSILSIVDGSLAIVDGDSGSIVLAPGPDLVTRYRQESDSRQRAAEAARANRALIVRTRDGQHVAILANVGGVADARVAVAAGAEGVGLLRTEVLFLGQDVPPDEDEQVGLYHALAEALEGRPMTIRTLDVGGDKPLNYAEEGSDAWIQPAVCRSDEESVVPRQLKEPAPSAYSLSRAETNPALGLRGIRWCLQHRHVFATQLRAIARVAVQDPIKVMFPMVTTVEELRIARSMLDDARQAIRSAGREVPGAIPVGVMIEVPAAALRIEDLASEVDFFSIGTNDLAQYVFAADRGNPRVASLVDAIHPAILRLIARVVEVAHAQSKTVALCGELAADPVATPLLVGLGVDELSMDAAAIPLVKQVIRSISRAEAESLARVALIARSAQEVRAFLRGKPGAGTSGAE